MVAYAVQLIDPDAPSFDQVMQRIAYKHISLGIRPEQYTIVGHHLLAAVGEVLGDAVTPEIAAAWDEVYWLFATQLDRAGGPALPAGGRRPGAAGAARTGWCGGSRRPTTSCRWCSSPADGGALPQIGPGQYVSVFVDLPDGRRQPRQYTVSSTAVGDPAADHRAPGARAWTAPRTAWSRRTCTTTSRSATSLDVSAPAGDFVVQPSDGPLLLASAGAGITTVLPIVEHIARTQPQRKVIVAHADRTAQDHALRDTVLHVGRQIDDFTAYTWYETRRPRRPALRAGLHGPRRRSRCPTDVQVFTCGPLPFMRHVRSSLLARGVPASRIRYEVFGPDLWAPQD